jgi:predicted RNase H-like HicB family nuclease
MKKTETTRNIEYYLSLPYTTILKKDEEGDVVARIGELDGCVSHGSDVKESVANLKAMQPAWIEACIESGRPVPEPEPVEELPSGKWVQRVPRSLHQQLVRLAKSEKVSLNSLVTAMLSAAAATKVLDKTRRFRGPESNGVRAVLLPGAPARRKTAVGRTR